MYGLRHGNVRQPELQNYPDITLCTQALEQVGSIIIAEYFGFNA